MGDSAKDANKDKLAVIEDGLLEKEIQEKFEVKGIILAEPAGRYSNQSSQPYYNQPPQGGYNQAPNQGQGYYSTPAYQQQVGGQPVYYAGGYPPPAQNVGRGGPVYRQNDPAEREEAWYFHRNTRIFTDEFNSIRIRNRFVQRVYLILSLQLFFTFGFIILAMYEQHIKRFFLQNWLPIMIVSMIFYLVIYLVIVCVSEVRRRFPLNFIMLGLLTIGMTFMLTVLSVAVNTHIVYYAMGTTALICFVVSLFAIQTKWDVTGCGMCLCIAMMVVMLFGLILMILTLCGIFIKLLHIVYSAIVTLLFSFWLMYDTQQIVGGRRVEMSPEEYIFGALCLYIDIIYIFWYLLLLYQLCLGDG